VSWLKDTSGDGAGAPTHHRSGRGDIRLGQRFRVRETAQCSSSRS